MSNISEYTGYAANKALELLAIDSPSGFTAKAAEWVKKEFEALGCKGKLDGESFWKEIALAED